MSRPVVIEAVVRPKSGKVDFHLGAGKEGKERVRVVLTTFGTFACMKDHSIDCVHSDVAREYFEEHRAELATEPGAAA